MSTNTKIWRAAHGVTKAGAGRGVRMNVSIFVYADGHGNLGAADGTNHPVDSSEQAIEALAHLWGKLRREAASNMKSKA